MHYPISMPAAMVKSLRMKSANLVMALIMQVNLTM